jgi:parallel beta-helix repeat protein
MILNNHISSCIEYAIYLTSSFNNNIVENNTCSNSKAGVYMDRTNGNIITKNTLYNNEYGILLWSCNYDNLIYLNNFINNTENKAGGVKNLWNSTSKITYTYKGKTYTNYLGNYWDDYTGSDSNGDGIGDTPHNIDEGIDNYPLVEGFENYFGGAEEYSALIKCISSETDFYKKSSETTFDSWWWTEKADEEMEEAMNVLASSLVGSVAGAELQLALLGTGSKIVKVIGPVGYMMTAYDVVNAISKGLDSRFYSDIGWAIAGDSVLIQGDLNTLVANGNNLTNALKDKNESRIESLLEKRAYLIKVVYEDLATIDKNAATSLKNPTLTIHLYVPSDEYQLIHSHAATLHFQLQRDYSVTISALNNLTEEECNPFLHEQCPEGKIEPQRLDKGELGWCYGCLDYTGDSDKFNIRVPSESDALCVVNTYGLHEISPANVTLRLEQDGELIKESSDKLIIESPEEGTYNLYVESRNGSQVYGFCTHTDLCGGWKILPTDIQPAWEAYPEYPDPIIIDYLTNPIKVDKGKVSTEEEITVSVNASNEGGKSAWQSIAISSPDIENTESYTILDSNLDYCEKYSIGYEAGYNYGNTTKTLKYPLIEGAKNNWEGGFTGNVTLKIKPEKEGILRVYAKSVAYGSGVWRSAPGIFETHTKDQQKEYVYEEYNCN